MPVADAVYKPVRYMRRTTLLRLLDEAFAEVPTLTAAEKRQVRAHARRARMVSVGSWETYRRDQMGDGAEQVPACFCTVAGSLDRESQLLLVANTQTPYTVAALSPALSELGEVLDEAIRAQLRVDTPKTFVVRLRG